MTNIIKKYNTIVTNINSSKTTEQNIECNENMVNNRIELLKQSIKELLALSYNIYNRKLICGTDEIFKLASRGILMPQQQIQDENTPNSLVKEHELLNKQFGLIFDSVNQCLEEMMELAHKPQIAVSGSSK